MKKICLVASLVLWGSLSAWARPARPASMHVTVTRDFEEADLVQVVKALAKDMGRNAYIGPGVDGKLSVSLQGVPPEAALASVLKMQPKPIAYKLIGRTVLVVTSPDKLSQIDSEIIGCNFSARPSQTGTDRTRREFLLNHAIAPALLPKLRAAYPDIEFIPHVLNGFYAVGTRQELARLGKAIPDIDVQPEDLTEVFYELEYQPVGELKPLLESLVPTLSTKPDPDDSATLVLRGIPEDVELGVALLDQLDRPPGEILFDFRLVSIETSALKELGIFWTPESGVGIYYPQCFGGPHARLNFLSQIGLADVVFTQNLTGTSGEEYLERLPEIAQNIRILAKVERHGRLHLSLQLGALKFDMPVEDGSLIVLRGVTPSSNKSRENLLIICPMAVY